MEKDPLQFGQHWRTCFGSTYTKIGTIQRRLAWPLRKDDTQNREAFHIFWDRTMLLIECPTFLFYRIQYFFHFSDLFSFSTQCTCWDRLTGWEQLFGSADTQTFSQCSSNQRQKCGKHFSFCTEQRANHNLVRKVCIMYVCIYFRWKTVQWNRLF